MKVYLLPENGKFYKANLHMHTTVSDGQMTPEEVKEAYMEKGYSIVAYTDHEALVPHTELTDENFVALTSYEIATNEGNAPGGWNYTRTYHINLYSPDPNKDISPVFTMSRLWPAHAGDYMSDAAKAVEWPREYSVASINALIARAREDGFLVSLNHPNWSLQAYEDYAELKGVWGVEWYNTGCVRAGYPDTVQPIDDLIAHGEKVFPLATDDAHASRANPHDCFGGFVMVKAEHLDYDSVFCALKNGDFYSSSAPLIEELYLEDGHLRVKTSPAAQIEVITDRRTRFRRTGDGLTEVDFDLSNYLKESLAATGLRQEPYFRVNVVDAAGEVARTRAYFPADWKL